MQIREIPKNFSETEVALFHDCPRCFYLALRYAVFRPNTEHNHKENPEQNNASESLVTQIIRVLEGQPPLQNFNCPYCTYRQRVRETGIENDLSG